MTRLLPAAVPAGTTISDGDMRASDDALVHLSPAARAHLRELDQQETDVSAQRRRLHARIDFVRGQGVTGNEVLDSQLAYLLEKEREISDRRRALHREIDRLRLGNEWGQNAPEDRGSR